jgi:pyridinium-3,5-bisthiocarboxylic acid mononucleotide nickel chelatase
LTASNTVVTINPAPLAHFLSRVADFSCDERLMKLAYFDCFSGISGDMTLGALVDAGCSADVLRSELQSLEVPGWELTTEKVWKNGMSATQVRVRTEDQQKHRSLSAILEILQNARLAARVRDRASAIFQKLGEAEAHVHDTPIEKIHFHEVGAVDAIVDIVGACIGLHALGVERSVCSPLNVGGGTAKTAHGVLPVPAPATARLLQGAPTFSNGVQRELVTPTGAAIVATLCDTFGAQPPMTVSAIGYGAGAADLEGQPNVLRIMIGESAEKSTNAQDEEISIIEANLDDMNPQIYGYVVEKALQAGALDVYTTALQMKKNRPGTLLTILCRPEDTEALTSLLFAETTTFGVRTHRAQRRALAREWVNVSTSYGDVRIKLSRSNGHILHAAPEYDDCRKLAVEKQVPLQQIITEALRSYEAGGKS